MSFSLTILSQCGLKIQTQTSVLNRNSIHAITYQMPIHTNTYHDTCQIHTNTRSVQHTGFRPAYKYWHVSWYVLVCIVQVFGMYYVMIPVNTSKYINTYQYVQYILFFQYISILVNMFKYMQYIPYIPMLTNTGQYCQIHTNTD